MNTSSSDPFDAVVSSRPSVAAGVSLLAKSEDKVTPPLGGCGRTLIGTSRPLAGPFPVRKETIISTIFLFCFWPLAPLGAAVTHALIFY